MERSIQIRLSNERHRLYQFGKNFGPTIELLDEAIRRIDALERKAGPAKPSSFESSFHLKRLEQISSDTGCNCWTDEVKPLAELLQDLVDTLIDNEREVGD